MGAPSLFWHVCNGICLLSCKFWLTEGVWLGAQKIDHPELVHFQVQHVKTASNQILHKQ